MNMSTNLAYKVLNINNNNHLVQVSTSIKCVAQWSWNNTSLLILWGVNYTVQMVHITCTHPYPCMYAHIHTQATQTALISCNGCTVDTIAPSHWHSYYNRFTSGAIWGSLWMIDRMVNKGDYDWQAMVQVLFSSFAPYATLSALIMHHRGQIDISRLYLQAYNYLFMFQKHLYTAWNRYCGKGSILSKFVLYS